MPHKRGTVLPWVCGLDGKTVDQVRRASELPFTSAALSDDLISPHRRIGRGFPGASGRCPTMTAGRTGESTR